MTGSINGANFQNGGETYRPSTIPLINFHGHMVKVFTSNPSERTFFEVVKKVVLAVIAPFVYLLLGCIAAIGYYYKIDVTKPVLIKDPDILPSWYKYKDPASRSLFVTEQTTENMINAVDDVFKKGHHISKIKCRFYCEISDQKKYFVTDILPSGESINSHIFKETVKITVEEVEKWCFEQFGIYGIHGRTEISGDAFCVGHDKGHFFSADQDKFHHASWFVIDSPKEGSSVNHMSCEIKKQDLSDYLYSHWEKMNVVFSEESATHFFGIN